MDVELLADSYAVCRLDSDAPVPFWAAVDLQHGVFSSITRTDAELSIVCLEAGVPDGIRAERGFRGLKLKGPLDFSEVGILARLTQVLAQVQVSVFAVSSYDTDYIFVPEGRLLLALESLEAAGYRITSS